MKIRLFISKSSPYVLGTILLIIATSIIFNNRFFYIVSVIALIISGTYGYLLKQLIQRTPQGHNISKLQKEFYSYLGTGIFELFMTTGPIGGVFIISNSNFTTNSALIYKLIAFLLSAIVAGLIYVYQISKTTK
ncbi:hypothetical protein OQI89_10320 [Lentilactobacillus diolivorans]|uniref:hypothetical protein n=1 Tax=Lentilactobacillus diolivorans TaxID=179838 RepID=UPI0024696D93|nr:hypothetical protein [Lentilactobacillus diolivorans]MDH5106244.1 hypothetical protein [Lentilactobacillus diolivorans]